MEIQNKKANYDYFIEDTYECGIVLKGSEIKSIRNGKANIKDSYGIIKNNELYILNMHISKYENSGVFSPDELRTRKLLVHKKEIYKLKQKINQGIIMIINHINIQKNLFKRKKYEGEKV